MQSIGRLSGDLFKRSSPTRAFVFLFLLIFPVLSSTNNDSQTYRAIDSLEIPHEVDDAFEEEMRPIDYCTLMYYAVELFAQEIHRAEERGTNPAEIMPSIELLKTRFITFFDTWMRPHCNPELRRMIIVTYHRIKAYIDPYYYSILEAEAVSLRADAMGPLSVAQRLGWSRRFGKLCASFFNTVIRDSIDAETKDRYLDYLYTTRQLFSKPQQYGCF